MRPYTSILATLTVVLLGCFAYTLIQKAMAPNVHVVDRVVFDGGNVSPGLPITHVFKIENLNSFPLGISAPMAGYSCTTATVSASTIPPHGTVDVELHVEPEDGALSGSASVITTHGTKTVETVLFVTAVAKKPNSM